MRPTLLRIAAAAATLAGIACTDNEALDSTSPNGQPKLYVTLSVESETVPETGTKSITARVTDQTGLLKLVPVTWTSTDPSVASVNGGTITGVSAGDAIVIASAGTGADSVGSSRVDLQACKLEYSIVSPK